MSLNFLVFSPLEAYLSAVVIAAYASRFVLRAPVAPPRAWRTWHCKSGPSNLKTTPAANYWLRYRVCRTRNIQLVFTYTTMVLTTGNT